MYWKSTDNGATSPNSVSNVLNISSFANRFARRSIDKDGDGIISFAELKATRLGKIMNDDALKTIMKKSAARKLGRDAEGLGKRPSNIRAGIPSPAILKLSTKLGTGRGKEMVVEAPQANTEEKERKFFEELKKKQEEKKKASHDSSVPSPEASHSPARQNLQRRGSFMKKIAEVGGIGRQVSRNIKDLGITFEDFAEEYFLMMAQKIEEQEVRVCYISVRTYIRSSANSC